MISFIISATDDGEALARLLSALVPAVAEGLAREAAVVGARGAAAEVAEDAGAGLYEGFGPAFEQARGPWVGGLPADAVLTADWMALVAAHLRHAPPAPARLVARGLSLRPGRAGWLAPKRLAPSAVVVEQDLQRLARGGRRLRVLNRAWDRPRQRIGR